MAALLFGVLNLIVKPLLFILTLPLTILTFGLFYFVVNALIFALAAALVPGFQLANHSVEFVFVESVDELFFSSHLSQLPNKLIDLWDAVMRIGS